ncbi:hypothetical protein LXL04_039760 [Taraxacum kok-saghyz]
MAESEIITWENGREILENAITKTKNLLAGLTEQPFSSGEYKMLYKTVYQMCHQKAPHDHRQALYDMYCNTFKDYIALTVLPSLQETCGEEMLRELLRWWSINKVMVRFLSRIFHPLDSSIISEKSLLSLRKVGLKSYRDEASAFLDARFIEEQLPNRTWKLTHVDGAPAVVLSMIAREREGEEIDGDLVRRALKVILRLWKKNRVIYKEEFEAPMLEQAEYYYSEKAPIWMSQNSVYHYIRIAWNCLRAEEDRSLSSFHFRSKKKLLKIVEHQLFSANADQFLNKDHSIFHKFLKKGVVNDLSWYYRVYKKVPGGLECISSIFKQHIAAVGGKLASTKKVSITRLILLHDKHLAYVTGSFRNHTLFQKAFNQAFEIVCNMEVSGSSSAELLATFCAGLLSDGNLSDEQFEDTLEKVVTLLRYINDRDVFDKFYRIKLAHRLLVCNAVENVKETIVFRKLREQFGFVFTLKMEGMFIDMTKTKETQSRFDEYLKQNNPNVVHRVNVLTSNLWPSYKPSEIKLPEEMVKCIQVYDRFYQTETKGRKLTWIFSLGTCHVIGKFDQKEMELIVTTYQACVLSLFNSSDLLSYDKIKTQLDLPDKTVARLLHSLSCTRYKILLKDPNTKTLSPTDYFKFNSKFTSSKSTIKIPLPRVDDESKKATVDVVKERPFVIEASIVRIMKTKRVLLYQQLVIECIEQLKDQFKPDRKAIKKKLEDLITRDYLERDKQDPNLIRYLA